MAQAIRHVTTQNRLVSPPYQYDAAGNMTYDGNHTYFYDAENRLVQVDGTFGTCSTSAACYGYDALGLRVEKATGSTYLDYLYDLAGNVVTEWCTNCGGYTGPTTEYILMSGNFVAEYKNSTTYFAHPDHLGSTRLLTSLDQSVAQNLDYLPFGEPNSSDSGITTHKFTSDERDSESGLDHTWFRQYSSSLGRWMHPDPAGLAAVDPTNPQSWNRYAYVLNSPMNLVDPTGLGDCNVFNGTYEGSGGGFPCPGSPFSPDGGTGGGGGSGGTGPGTPGAGAGGVGIDPWYTAEWGAGGLQPPSSPPFGTMPTGPGDPQHPWLNDGPIPGCSGPTGTANVQTNCGTQFGNELTVPKWYLDEANLNSTTTTSTGSPSAIQPGITTQISGWQVIYQRFGITDLTGPSVPNFFRNNPPPSCAAAAQRLILFIASHPGVPPPAGGMSAACSGL